MTCTSPWKRSLSILALASGLAGSAAAGVPPPNDLCIDAIPVGVPSSTPGATTSAGIDTAAGFCVTSITAPGVWYSVTGTGNTMTASTCDAANYDTKISVYCGDCSVDLANLVCVTGNDDGPGCAGFTSEASWCSQAGAEYLILVHGFGAGTGTFTLSISDDGAPCVGGVACPGADPISAFCFGTAPAPCNCGNHGADGNGCANGVYPDGANLLAAPPNPTLGPPPMPSLTLFASGMTPLSLCILLQGSEWTAGGTGVPFGDGLLCVGGSLMRLGVRPTFLGATRFQVMTPLDFVSLGTLYYQVIYITPGTFDVCGDQGRNLNGTNGLRVEWFM